MLTAPALVESLVDAKYASIVTSTCQRRFVFVDVKAYMRWIRTQGLGVLINRLASGDVQRFEDACAARLSAHRAPDGYELVKSVDLTVAVSP
jgi:hypothetical protein